MATPSSKSRMNGSPRKATAPGRAVSQAAHQRNQVRKDAKQVGPVKAKHRAAAQRMEAKTMSSSKDVGGMNRKKAIGRNNKGVGLNPVTAVGRAARAVNNAGANVARGMKPIGQINPRVTGTGVRDAIGNSNPIDQLFKGISERLANPRGNRR